MVAKALLFLLDYHLNFFCSCGVKLGYVSGRLSVMMVSILVRSLMDINAESLNLELSTNRMDLVAFWIIFFFMVVC